MASFFDPFLEMARVQRDINALFGDANRHYLDNYTANGHPLDSLTDDHAPRQKNTAATTRREGDTCAVATQQPGWLSNWNPRLLTPRLDVWEESNQTVAKLEVPGFAKENLKIEVADGMLRLSGEIKQEDKKESQNLVHSERRFGSFSRAIRLPKNIKEDDIRASYENGVLQVTVPHMEPPKEQRRLINIA